MAEEMVVSSSTDAQEQVSGAAQNNPQTARVEALVPESQELDGSMVLAVEDKNSSRRQLERLLPEADELTNPDSPDLPTTRVETNEDEGEDTDAQAAGPDWTRPEHPYFERMKEAYEWYGPQRIAEIVQPVLQSGIDVSPGIASAIAELPNGPEVLLNLCKDPFVADGLVDLNGMTRAQAIRTLNEWSWAVDELAKESGRETQPLPRKSNAPRPISPISGSSTKSHVSIDDPNLSFQDYRKLRDQQQKTRFRR
jgi:hypothetical protein